MTTCPCCHSCASRVPIFQGLEPAQLAPFNSILLNRELKDQELVYHQGDVSNCLYIVNTGRVKLFRISPGGREQVLRILEPGDFFGEVVLFAKGALSASAQALGETKLCLLEKTAAEEIIRQHPDIAQRLIAALGERLQQAEEQIEALGTRTTLQRVAALLSDLADAQQSQTIKLPLTREGLASLTGMTTENFSRKLSELQAAGIIQPQGQKTIVIKNNKGLQEML